MISSQTRKAGPYSGDGSVTVFPFSFKVFSTSDVQVVYTDTSGVETVLSSGFVVTLSSDQNTSPGGVVTMSSAPALNTRITLTSAVAETQPMQLTNGGGFFPSVLNNSADRQTIIVQQLSERVSRAITAPISSDEPEGGITIPSVPNRVGMLLGFDADGRIVPVQSGGIADPGLRTDLASLLAGTSLLTYVNSGATAAGRSLQTILRERPTVRDNGATGNGAGTNDYVKLASALSDYGGKQIAAVPGDYRSDTTLGLAAGTRLVGDSQNSSIFRRVSGDAHLFNITAADVSLENLTLIGSATGTDATSNSGIKISTTSRTRLQNVTLSGMAGSGIYSAEGSDQGRFLNVRVTARSGALANSSDVMLYNSTSQNITAFSILAGGGHTGIYQQQNSSRNVNAFNYIENQHGYGILDYQPLNGYTSQILNIGNHIDGIVGDKVYGLDRRFGAGIYTAGSGGNISAFNFITNCNQQTDNETLVPAGIGHNMLFTDVPVTDIGNYIFNNTWYGYCVVEAVSPAICVGTVSRDNGKEQIYYKNSSNGVIVGNAADTVAVGSTAERSFSVNAASASFHTGFIISSNRVRGGTFRVFEMQKTTYSVIVGNNISDVPATKVGVWIEDCNGTVWTGNVVDGSGTTNYAMRVRNSSYSTFTGSVILTNASAPIALQIDATNTNCLFDKSILIFGKPEPMNFIANESAGCIVEQFGSGPPTLNPHQVGDRVYARGPSAGGNIGWVCTTAGTPGTWKTFGAIAA